MNDLFLVGISNKIELIIAIRNSLLCYMLLVSCVD